MEGNKIDTCQFVKGLGLKLKMWFPERDSRGLGAGGEGLCVCVCVQVSRLSISEDRECVCVFRCLDSASLKAQGLYVCVCVCVCVLVIQSCLTLCNPTEYSPPDFSVHGILQARRLEWIAISFSKGTSQPRDPTLGSCIAGRFFTV